MSATFDLDKACGRFFTYRDLIECGKTWSDHARNGIPIDNAPRTAATLTALKQLCVEVLDPVAAHFGTPELTYGLACGSLTSRISGGIAPRLDQHASHERGRGGRPICSRLGAAVDLLVPGTRSSDLARWIFGNTKFDRMYLYGDERPIHVSHGPDHSRLVVELVEGTTGRRTPKILRWKHERTRSF